MNPIWEERYASGSGGDALIGEFHDLMRYIGEPGRMLELGCGSGVNVSQFLAMRADYYGLDGSETAIRNAREKFPYITDRFNCLDFTKPLPYERQYFDFICERASIPHNLLASIEKTIEQVFAMLKPGGVFISSDWFSWLHSEFERGDGVADDGTTRSGYEDGQFRHAGTVHFSSLDELVSLFRKFEVILMQERIKRFPDGMPRPHWVAQNTVSYQSAVWDIVVRKPK